MDQHRISHQSELFTVRMWPEDLGEGQVEWRGKVQHAISGETRYFRDWSALLAFFAEVLTTQEAVAGLEHET
ncbi:MAG: hypothetical protein BWY52_01157 [Chloroflexi bacterium ADurb.Bin325]|nr:MAG: hypothetical protein BWY52_01157 [Chloroflexi bacterium ADurb.Bin325]